MRAEEWGRADETEHGSPAACEKKAGAKRRVGSARPRASHVRAHEDEGVGASSHSGRLADRALSDARRPAPQLPEHHGQTPDYHGPKHQRVSVRCDGSLVGARRQKVVIREGCRQLGESEVLLGVPCLLRLEVAEP